MARGSAEPHTRRRRADVRPAVREEVDRIRSRLKLLIHLSRSSQRQVERRAGFSKGYLSQLLCGNIDLKYRHLLSVLEALEVPAYEFFADLYPERPSRLLSALAHFRRESRPIDPQVREQIARLYGIGLASLEDLSERLDRCEDALGELEALGLLGGERPG